MRTSRAGEHSISILNDIARNSSKISDRRRRNTYGAEGGPFVLSLLFPMSSKRLSMSGKEFIVGKSVVDVHYVISPLPYMIKRGGVP
jgi:hypothetical protein